MLILKENSDRVGSASTLGNQIEGTLAIATRLWRGYRQKKRLLAGNRFEIPISQYQYRRQIAQLLKKVAPRNYSVRDQPA